MKTNQLARFAAVALALAGVASLIAAGVVSLSGFDYQPGPAQRYDCGSVLFAKDPRDLASRRAQVPQRFIQANRRCEALRRDRTSNALTFMLVGAVPLLIVLALPFLSRRSRRTGRRRRMRM